MLTKVPEKKKKKKNVTFVRAAVCIVCIFIEELDVLGGVPLHKKT